MGVYLLYPIYQWAWVLGDEVTLGLHYFESCISLKPFLSCFSILLCIIVLTFAYHSPAPYKVLKRVAD